MRKLAEILVENIRRKMDALGWNQADLARESKINRVLISKYLSETNVPSIETLWKISEALDTQAGDLLRQSEIALPEMSKERRALIELASSLPEPLLPGALLMLRGALAGFREGGGQIPKKPRGSG